ncbi:hypothetical protein [Hymenobacter terrestris]|uniref:Uncharacterized protein n=1 Tax=Hymenobacter terrestris TaxID=2748310 RepID=A0ABX2Q494_9BACT|nr:hypothetical protein [Hymenobacter terrestris]NVO84597.1 hypothetical protein [Hymenobacter terrestris]
MPFTVQKTITPPPVFPGTTTWEYVKAAPLLVGGVAAAVLMGIVVLPILLVLGTREKLAQLIRNGRQRLGYPSLPVPPPEVEEPAVLFRNGQLELIGIYQEREEVGAELLDLFNKWEELASQEQYYPSLYLLQTIPEIPGLHGQIVSDLCREWSDGLFLQLVEPHPEQEPAGTTWLMYLELATLRWHRVVETNDYYLHPEASEPEHGAFDGLNPAGEKLELRVQTDA